MERLTHALVRSLLGDGKGAEALLAAATMLEANPTDLTAWHLLSGALAAEGREAEAREAFAGLARAYERAGDLPMALAAALEHERAGGEAAPLLEALAGAYSAAASDLVDDVRPSPPRVPRPAEADLRAARRKDHVDAKVETALALAESASTSAPARPRRYFPLLSALGAEAFVRFAARLEPRAEPPGTEVVAQGAPGDAFYLVARGEVRVVRRHGEDDTLLARLGPGGFFGEMAVVSRAPRAARVETADDVVLLRADMEVVDALRADVPEISEVLTAFCRARMLENLVLASPVLARVPLAERPALFTRFTERPSPPGATLIREGEPSDGLHLIVSGELEVTRDEEGETLTLARLGPGDLFGEISLVLRRPATATVTAASEALTLQLPRESFLEVIHEQPTLLTELYDLALRREEETATILAREAVDADDLILV